MPHVVVLDPIHPDGIARLQGAPGVTLDHPGTSGGTLPERLRDAEALIVRGTAVDQALLDMAPRLRMACRHGVGYDLVDVPACTARGVAVMITPEANAASVAEHALMLMLAVARQVLPVDAGVRAGHWRVQGQSRTFELGGRRVLLLGFGRIGSRVARLCTAFGMQVAVHDPFLPAGTIRGAGYMVEKELLPALGRADIVSLHLPASDATRGMVDPAFLAAMKPGAVLINTARGTLVDEDALAAALADGSLGGAGLDVLRVEPMIAPPPLLSCPNLVVTPHVAASTAEGLQRMAWDAAGNVLEFLAGRPDPDAVVNREVLRGR
ncbi:hydroxyacid dehydrogenase [Pararoseomonas indoligenes]|uniref:Hydroxyacid dehydrogenase n=1 Tax=Roseomonas indoligenes TaxID=2820811 RepID=A0A940MV60_9PROT|nr:hydroxyacid dehydrogenase [Pararoseomonas indoligenes]MBP0494748.1 hydroxyacid dehydrogenase [Pararoseomonas indoligenes]